MTQLFECNRCGSHVYEEIEVTFEIFSDMKHLCQKCWNEIFKKDD